jgi:hypothetical protein
LEVQASGVPWTLGRRASLVPWVQGDRPNEVGTGAHRRTLLHYSLC